MPKKLTKAEALNSPKGMHDILENQYYDYQGFFEKASDVALYYGFKPIETPVLEREDVFLKSQGEGTDIIDKEMYTLKTKGGHHLAMRPEGTAGIMRAYIEHGMQALPQPVMFYYYGPYFRHENPQRGRLREFRQFGLEILGTEKSIADALVIKAFFVILEEAGFSDMRIDINSIGDQNCRPAYIKELLSYYRKHVNDVCAHCRQRMKTNPLRLLDCKNSKCQELREDAPAPMSHLCTPCRAHFKEVLEYLEALEIPYTINNHLVRGLDYYTKTVFEIFDCSSEEECVEDIKEEEIKDGENADEKDSDEKDSDEKNEKEEKKPEKKAEVHEPLAIASGGRYDDLSKTLGSKKEVFSVGGSIGVDRLIMSPKHKKLSPRIKRKPKVYFIQLGFEAKLKSLTVIDILRKAHVPIAQSLSKNSLAAQLGHAEKIGVPYTLIFGQKEAMDETVLIRNMHTRSQETVKIANLTEHLKTLK